MEKYIEGLLIERDGKIPDDDLKKKVEKVVEMTILNRGKLTKENIAYVMEWLR